MMNANTSGRRGPSIWMGTIACEVAGKNNASDAMREKFLVRWVMAISFSLVDDINLAGL